MNNMMLTEREKMVYEAVKKGGKVTTKEVVDECTWKPDKTRRQIFVSCYGIIKRLIDKGLVKKSVEVSGVGTKIYWEIEDK